MLKIYTNEEPAETTGDDWVDVTDVPGTNLPANTLTIINEGDFPGFWRLVDTAGNATKPARLPCGGGSSGERKAGFNVPCPGFNGTLQVRRGGPMSGHLSGIWGIFMG